MIQKSPNPEGPFWGPFSAREPLLGPIGAPGCPYKARWAFGPRERSLWGRWAGMCEHARRAFLRNRQDRDGRMCYVFSLLGLFTYGTSSFDIIGAMKPLSYFRLTSLSDPIARTADTRQASSIPVDFPLFLYLANLLMLAICSKE